MNKNMENSTPEYTMGYTDEFRQLLERRSAENHAAHLLPYLKPGMRLLDFGCGPGMIAVGLAKSVEPGQLHGIDMEESQVEMARTAVAASTYALPCTNPVRSSRCLGTGLCCIAFSAATSVPDTRGYLTVLPSLNQSMPRIS